MKKLLTAIMLLPLAATAQIDIKVGMNSNLSPTITADVGYMRQYKPIMAVSYSWQGFNSYGAYAGYMGHQIAIYAGASYAPTSVKMQYSNIGPVIGFSWKDAQGKGVLDIRYMHGVQITMGVRLW